MRPIHLARLDKVRPVLVLTRSQVRERLNSVTIAPITSTRRGIVSEVPVGPENGLDHASVISLDNVTTIEVERLGRRIGGLRADQEQELVAALHLAYDLPSAY